MDEAGRGPLAGPVVAACVLLDPGVAPPEDLDDSKRLSEAVRERLYQWVVANALAYRIASRPPERIDQINILNATMEAMVEAIEGLSPRPDLVFVDGNRAPSTTVRAMAVVKADRLSWNVAAASILAKVTRDRIMVELDHTYPGYGFARHKGYPTRDHLTALARLGPSPVHRRSFGPVARLLAGTQG